MSADDLRSIVVVNAEQQYAFWPAGRGVPEGWKAAGPEGTREECLAFVRQAWRDLRPASVRRRQDAPQSGA